MKQEIIFNYQTNIGKNLYSFFQAYKNEKLEKPYAVINLPLNPNIPIGKHTSRFVDFYTQIRDKHPKKIGAMNMYINIFNNQSLNALFMKDFSNIIEIPAKECILYDLKVNNPRFENVDTNIRIYSEVSMAKELSEYISEIYKISHVRKDIKEKLERIIEF